MLSPRLKVLSVFVATLVVATKVATTKVVAIYVFAIAPPISGLSAKSVNVSGTCVPTETPLTPTQRAELRRMVNLKRAEVEKALQAIPQLDGAKIKVIGHIAPWGKNCAEKG